MHKQQKRLDNVLLERIKQNLPEIEELLWKYQDDNLPYRFYHQSYKVYATQEYLLKAQKLFRKISGKEMELNAWWAQITQEALVGPFDISANKDWLKNTRPQIEAFFHTKFFLEKMVEYGKSLNEAPDMLPEGWAAVLYLFNIR